MLSNRKILHLVPVTWLVFAAAAALPRVSADGGEVQVQGEEPAAPGTPAGKPVPPSRVVFAGYGWPEEIFDISYRELLSFLRSEGVVLRKDPGDQEPDWMNAGSFEYFRTNLKDLGADSLLYMRLDLGEAQKDQLILRCYDAKGGFLWEERTAGIMAMSYRGAGKALTKRMKKKLGPHIGRPGLPVDPGAVRAPGKK